MHNSIGIFTIHSNTNFGGGLQQIALFEILSELGYKPQVVCLQNDTPKSIWRRILGVVCSYGIRNVVRELRSRILKNHGSNAGNYGLYRRCDAFNYATLNYTPKFGMKDLPGYCKRYDAIIVGSDQVWTDVYSAVLPYFCDGIGDFFGKRIAYAACSVHNSVPFYNRDYVRTLLDKFDGISVRDRTTARMVENVGLETPAIVADPSLLYDYEKYIKPVQYDEPYIFAYVLDDKSSEWHTKNIDHIRKNIGNLKVVAITVELDDEYPWANEVLRDELSVDWMNLLRCSAFVYTNSFHATIFSLKFHREFIAYYGDLIRSSRMIDLRDQFLLHDRIVKNPLLCDLRKPLPFEFTDKIIAELKMNSLLWLKEKLVGIEDCREE